MKYTSLLLVSIVLLISCGKNNENSNSLWNVKSNLDDVNIWINSNTLCQGNAHSGLFSSKIDSLVEYGIGISVKLQDMTTSVPKKANVHCWIYSNEPNLDASIVCDPNLNGQCLNYQNFNLQTSIPKSNEWIEFKTSFDLPENITPDTDLKIYFWNPSKKTFFVDDFEVSLE